METNNVEERIKNLENKIDLIYISVEKTRKYFKNTMIITIVLFVLPLIGLLFALPAFLNNYLGNIQSLM